MKFLQSRPLKFLLIFFSSVLLTFISTWSHWKLHTHGLILLHSDYAPGAITANQIRAGEFPIFHLGMHYGGTLLTYVQAIWASLFEHYSLHSYSIFGEAPIQWEKYWFLYSHTSYNYIFSPVLLALCSFYFALQYVSFLPAFLTGFVGAIGFHFWTITYGNHPYLLNIIFGGILLLLRKNKEEPLSENSLPKNFIAGIISGLAVYNYRASLLYVFIYLFPLKEEFWVLLKQSFLNKKIFTYLKLILIQNKQPLTFFTIGGLIGFLPEIVFILTHARIPKPGVGHPASILQTLSAIITFYEPVLSLVGVGGKLFSDVKDYSKLLYSLPSLCILLIGVYHLFIDARKNRPLKIFFVFAFICILAYLFTETYTFKTPRYLFPIFPFFIVCFAYFFQWSIQNWKKGFPPLIALALFTYHASAHLEYRTEPFTQAQINYEIGMELIDKFRRENVKVVITDSFWHTNHLTFIAQNNPVFVSREDIGLKTREGIHLATTENRVGLLILYQGDKANITGKVKAFDRKFKVKKIGKQEPCSNQIGYDNICWLYTGVATP